MCFCFVLNKTTALSCKHGLIPILNLTFFLLMSACICFTSSNCTKTLHFFCLQALCTLDNCSAQQYQHTMTDHRTHSGLFSEACCLLHGCRDQALSEAIYSTVLWTCSLWLSSARLGVGRPIILARFWVCVRVHLILFNFCHVKTPHSDEDIYDS